MRNDVFTSSIRSLGAFEAVEREVAERERRVRVRQIEAILTAAGLSKVTIHPHHLAAASHGIMESHNPDGTITLSINK